MAERLIGLQNFSIIIIIIIIIMEKLKVALAPFALSPATVWMTSSCQLAQQMIDPKQLLNLLYIFHP